MPETDTQTDTQQARPLRPSQAESILRAVLCKEVTIRTNSLPDMFRALYIFQQIPPRQRYSPLEGGEPCTED